MRGKLSFFLALILVLTPSLQINSQEDGGNDWYEEYTPEYKVKTTPYYGAGGERRRGAVFFFYNEGQTMYVIEAKLMDSNFEYNPWTPWLQNWKSGEWDVDKKILPRSVVWSNKEEESFHYFIFKNDLYEYPDMLLRLKVVKTSEWKNYVNWAYDLIRNTD